MKVIRQWWYEYRDLVIQWIIIAVFGAVVLGFYQYHVEQDRPLVAYLNRHKCQELGRVGQPAQSVYQCDNGLHLENDLRKETGT
jgi:hypothetical protein